MVANRRKRETETQRPLIDDGSSRLLIATGYALWDNAALLMTLSLLIMLVSLPFLVLASIAGWWAAWLPMVMALAPIWFVAILVGDRILDGRGVAVRELPRLIAKHVRLALTIAIVPALSGQLVLTLGHVASGEKSSDLASAGLLLSLGILLAVAILAGPTFASAVRFETDARDAWILGARVIVAAPFQQLGLVCCFGIVIWSVVAIGPVVLLALAPFAVLTAAVARVPLGNPS